MAFAHTSRSVGNRAPKGLFSLNKDSSQAKGLVGWWPSLDPYATKGYSLSKFNQAITSGTPDHITYPGIGRGVKFVRASTEAIEFAANIIPSTDSPVDGAISLFAWVIPDDAHTSEFGGIAGQAQYPSNGRVDYYLTARNGVFNFQLSDSGTVVAGATSYTNGQLYLAGLSRSKAVSGTGRVWLNGLQDGSGSSGSRDALDTTQKFQIGRWYSSTHAFTGRVFEVRVYNREVTAAEAWQMYAPQTRWDLRWQKHKTIFLPEAAVGGARPQGPLGHPFYGPLAGPIAA